MSIICLYEWMKMFELCNFIPCNLMIIFGLCFSIENLIAHFELAKNCEISLNSDCELLNMKEKAIRM